MSDKTYTLRACFIKKIRRLKRLQKIEFKQFEQWCFMFKAYFFNIFFSPDLYFSKRILEMKSGYKV